MARAAAADERSAPSTVRQPAAVARRTSAAGPGHPLFASPATPPLIFRPFFVILRGKPKHRNNERYTHGNRTLRTGTAAPSVAQGAARAGHRALSRRPLRGDRHGTRHRRQLRRRAGCLSGSAHRRPHHVAPHHGQRLLLRTAGRDGPHSGLHPPRRHLPRRRPDALQHGIQETARHRRLRRRGGLRLPHQHGRAVGALPPLHGALEVGASAARGQGEGRQDVRRLHRSRDPLPPALPRFDRQSAGQGDLRQASQDHGHDALLLQRARLPRGRDPDPAADSGRRLGASLHHAPQLARRRPLPAHRYGALPQEADRGRLRRRLRVRQELPQRGHGPHAQPRVHLHGDLRRLQGLQVDDGVHRADARTRGSGRQRHDGGRDRRP